MKRLRIVLTGVLALVVLACLALGVTGTVYLRRPLPQDSGELTVSGLRGEVTIKRDEYGTPHIYADNPADLFYAQGLVHAQDRFFEMDLRRRVATGHAAELIGQSAVDGDVMVRTLGWVNTAEQELSKLSPETRSALQSYADGVNGYAGGRSGAELDVAYPILGTQGTLPRIESWTPRDSLAWTKAMAWDLRTDYSAELARARAFGTVRDEVAVNQLFPPYPADRNAPILPSAPAPGASAGVAQPAKPQPTPPAKASASSKSQSGKAPPQVPAQPVEPQVLTGDTRDALQTTGLTFASIQARLQEMNATLGHDEGIGSNAWVVAGQYTETGKPLLANDPHLAVSQPGPWYQVGLHCRKVSSECPYDVSGFSLAGMPGVLIGHNSDVGWGTANLNADSTDFFIEDITSEGVLRDGKRVPVTTRQESVPVLGRDQPVKITVRSTDHGPVISDVNREALEAVGAAPPAPPPGQTPPPSDATVHQPPEGGYSVSIAWTGLQPGRSMDAVLAMNRAKDWESFRAAAAQYEIGSQSFVYADTAGNIGYQATGRIPVRPANPASSTVAVRGADGSWPRPGWDPAWDWTGTVDPSLMPWAYNPEQGFIVAANQMVNVESVRLLGSDYDYGYRAQRIRALLTDPISKGQKLNAVDMNRIQNDDVNTIAPVLVPALLGADLSDISIIPASEKQFTGEGVSLLRAWADRGHHMNADSAGGAFFSAAWENLRRLTFADEPGGVVPTDDSSRWAEVMKNLLQQPNSRWWDNKSTPTVLEQRDQILTQALYNARQELTAGIGKEPRKWRWGQLHRVQPMTEPLATEVMPGVLRTPFVSGPLGVPGCRTCVNAMSWDPRQPRNSSVTTAPSMRMVVDFGRLDGSTWVNMTGQSGHAVSKHFSDQFELWAWGRTLTWAHSAQAVEGSTAVTLTLKPGPAPG